MAMDGSNFLVLPVLGCSSSADGRSSKFRVQLRSLSEVPVCCCECWNKSNCAKDMMEKDHLRSSKIELWFIL